MAKHKVDPFRRGMGAKDDLIAEQFVPTDDYKARQMEMVQRLIAAGLSPEELTSMFLVPYDLLLREKPNDM
jgi:hypothetical protein